MKKMLLIIGWLATSTMAVRSQQDSLSNDVNALKKAVTLMAWVKKFHLSGYGQVQFQHADTDNVKTFEGGNFATNSNNRFMLRRARIKLEFAHQGKAGVVNYYACAQINVSENGINMVEYYARLIDPWTNALGITGGMMNRPFGYEVIYSSRLRESPERGRMSQILFPKERDLGFMVTVEPPQHSKMAFFKINAGVYNGTGLGFAEIDKRKDFIGQVVLYRSFLNKKLHLSGGASYYYGGVLQSTKAYYTFKTDTGALPYYHRFEDSTGIGKRYFKREYIGFDAQLTGEYKWGQTTVRAEYIFGTQPGTLNDNAAPVTTGADIYVRRFNGAYFYLVQGFKDVRHNMWHELVFKYDWFDPNTQITGKNISAGADIYQTVSDIKYQSFGFGYNFKPTEWLKLMCYYALVKNEGTGLKGYMADIKDDVLTIRVQFMFK